MSRLYKRTTLFVSRRYYHGGDGLEDLGLVFYRTKEEYAHQAAQENWFDGSPSYKSGWCIQPREITVLVNGRQLKRLESGEIKRLLDKDVAFPTASLSELAKVHY